MGKFKAIDEQIEREREHIQRLFRNEDDKIGTNPDEPYHPIFNPSLEEEQQRAKSEATMYRREKKRQLSKSQEIYYSAAVALIRSGKVKTYAELGAAFTQYDKRRGNGPLSPAWAFKIVNKMVHRGTFTREEIARLIQMSARSKTRSSERKR